MSSLEDARLPRLREKHLIQAEAVEVAEDGLVEKAVKRVAKRLKGKK